MIYILSNRAHDDLVSIWEYTAAKWSVKQADQYIDLLVTRLSWLTTHRGLWRSRPEILEGLFSYSEKRHIFFFQEDPKGLRVIRILNQSMDLKRVFDQ